MTKVNLDKFAKFQFLLVRLRALRSQSFDVFGEEFQFLLVRLRGCYNNFPDLFS